MSVPSGATGQSGFHWHENDAFLELQRLGEEWELRYGFEATATRPRVVVRESRTADYQDAVRQIRQVIAYYFAEPEQAERVRRELLARAGFAPGASQYLPLPDAKYVTAAGGGAAAEAQAATERERREHLLHGEPEPESPPAAPPPAKRPWWKRFVS